MENLIVKSVYIRADGGAEFGMGHLVRCIALSQMIKSHFSISFICKEIPIEIKLSIEEIGFNVQQITEEADWLNNLDNGKIVVLDHYVLNKSLQIRVKELGCKLVCIDDTNDHDFLADLIINHSPGIREFQYTAQPYTRFALGLDFALLRPAFLSAAKSKKVKADSKTVFICFGGSDERNLTTKALKLVLNEYMYEKIIVVIGVSFQHNEILKKTIGNNQKVELYSSLPEDKMVEYLENSELTIVPSSSLLLECLAVGCKVISGYYVDNQKSIYQYFRKINAFIDAKRFENSDILRALRSSRIIIDEKSKLIDGNSNNRILQLFIELSSVIRKACPEDDLLFFKWANDTTVRYNAIQTEPIILQKHLKWFKNRLIDSNTRLFVIEFNNIPVGQIRYEFENNYWKIDYSIDANFRGLGLGKIIISKTLSRIDGTIKAWVKEENIASNKVFQALKFTESSSEFEGLNEYSFHNKR